MAKDKEISAGLALVLFVIWTGLGIYFAVLFWSFPIRWFGELMVAGVTVGGWAGIGRNLPGGR